MAIEIPLTKLGLSENELGSVGVTALGTLTHLKAPRDSRGQW